MTVYVCINGLNLYRVSFPINTSRVIFPTDIVFLFIRIISRSLGRVKVMSYATNGKTFPGQVPRFYGYNDLKKSTFFLVRVILLLCFWIEFCGTFKTHTPMFITENNFENKFIF